MDMAAKELDLRVVASSLEGGGDARMAAENMEALRVKEGEEVEIRKEKYSVLLTVKEDTIYDPEAVRLRAEDIFLLGAREGDMVSVFLPGKGKKPAKKTAKKPTKKSKKKKSKKTKKGGKKKSKGGKNKTSGASAEKEQRCAAKTKSGKRCKRNAKKGSKYCGIHQK